MPEQTDLFHSMLQLAVQNGASDIHLKSNHPASFRIRGGLEPIDMDPLTVNQILGFIETSCPGSFYERWQLENQIDYSYKIDGLGRFRVNAFYQRGSPSMVFRHVKDEAPSFEDLNHDPEVLINLCKQKDGILLVCGPTGSGKSSTLAAMLNWINHNQEKHIVTLEDPIEFNYKDKKCLFNQREIGIDTPTFAHGIKSVLRQDPDIILIGEMRDAETFNTALTAAETGHYVLATLHSANAQQSVQRLFEFYPPDQHLGLRRQVAGALRGTVTQRLVPSLDNSTRLPVLEVFVVENIARSAIAEGQFEKIPAIIDATAEAGARSFNKDLFRLIKAGAITKQTGLNNSPNPKALEMNLKGIFLSSGGIVG